MRLPRLVTTGTVAVGVVLAGCSGSSDDDAAAADESPAADATEPGEATADSEPEPEELPEFYRNEDDVPQPITARDGSDLSACDMLSADQLKKLGADSEGDQVNDLCSWDRVDTGYVVTLTVDHERGLSNYYPLSENPASSGYFIESAVADAPALVQVINPDLGTCRVHIGLTYTTMLDLTLDSGSDQPADEVCADATALAEQLLEQIPAGAKLAIPTERTAEPFDVVDLDPCDALTDDQSSDLGGGQSPKPDSTYTSHGDINSCTWEGDELTLEVYLLPTDKLNERFNEQASAHYFEALSVDGYPSAAVRGEGTPSSCGVWVSVHDERTLSARVSYTNADGDDALCEPATEVAELAVDNLAG